MFHIHYFYPVQNEFRFEPFWWLKSKSFVLIPSRWAGKWMNNLFLEPNSTSNFLGRQIDCLLLLCIDFCNHSTELIGPTNVISMDSLEHTNYSKSPLFSGQLDHSLCLWKKNDRWSANTKEHIQENHHIFSPLNDQGHFSIDSTIQTATCLVCTESCRHSMKAHVIFLFPRAWVHS